MESANDLTFPLRFVKCTGRSFSIFREQDRSSGQWHSRQKQERERLIDRLESKAHQAAIEITEAAWLLEQQSDICVGEVSQTRLRKCGETQWLYVLMCTTETATATSRTACSLATLRAQSIQFQLSIYNHDNGPNDLHPHGSVQTSGSIQRVAENNQRIKNKEECAALINGYLHLPTARL